MLKRTLEKTIRRTDKTFPVLLLTGPRQVGKTTLLEACSSTKRGYVTLDDFRKRDLAKSDPALFLQTYPPPLIIDEVQYAPGLFSAIKMAVDREKKNGMFWLTGSQKFHLMKGITESLAGRVAILDMLGLSHAEIEGRSAKTEPFLPGRERGGEHVSVREFYKLAWRGSFPRLISDKKISRDVFYKSYVQTYIQRDVRDMLKIGDEISFSRFLQAAAARTGQLLNYSDMARDAGIDHKTAKAWLSVLEASGLVCLLQPYHRNLTKRLVKTPKLYFLDTGLASYLTQWPSPESLEAGAMSGAILESWAFSEILKSYWHNGVTPNFYYYRDTDGKEIDLVMETGGKLYPVEFKKTANPSPQAFRHFKELEKMGALGQGTIICFVKEATPLSRDITAMPIGWL